MATCATAKHAAAAAVADAFDVAVAQKDDGGVAAADVAVGGDEAAADVDGDVAGVRNDGNAQHAAGDVTK